MLSNWGVKGGYTAFECFQIWEMSGYNQLPYAGGFLQQPSWVKKAFLKLLQVKRLHHLKSELDKKKTAK